VGTVVTVDLTLEAAVPGVAAQVLAGEVVRQLGTLGRGETVVKALWLIDDRVQQALRTKEDGCLRAVFTP
jgi:hypothetical protein